MELFRNGDGVDMFTSLRLLCYNYLSVEDREALSKADLIYNNKLTSFADIWESSQNGIELERKITEISEGDGNKLSILLSALMVNIKILKIMQGEDVK